MNIHVKRLKKSNLFHMQLMSPRQFLQMFILILAYSLRISLFVAWIGKCEHIFSANANISPFFSHFWLISACQSNACKY